MVEMSQDSVSLDLNQEQLKLCLIALDVFNSLINHPVLQSSMVELIKHSEKFYGFTFDTKEMFKDLSKFSDKSIGVTCDQLFEKYEELECKETTN